MDSKLGKALRNYRLVEARKLEKSAFEVFTNKQLELVVDRLPLSMQELLALPGFGQQECDVYGGGILSVTKAFAQHMKFENRFYHVLDKKDENQKRINGGTLFHGVVQGRYNVTADLSLAKEVKDMCKPTVFHSKSPGEFIGVCAKHYSIVRVALTYPVGTDTWLPIYGIICRLSSGQTVIFNAFIQYMARVNDDGPFTRAKYMHIEELAGVKLSSCNCYLERALEMEKLSSPPWAKDNLGSWFPSLLWFSSFPPQVTAPGWLHIPPPARSPR